MTPGEMAAWLRKGDFRPSPSQGVMPLELLALRTAVQTLSLDREETLSQELWSLDSLR